MQIFELLEHRYTALSYRFRKKDVRNVETEEQFIIKLNPETLENLAKTEHLRWNVHHFLNGWNTLELRDIPETQAILRSKNKNCMHVW